MRYNPKIHHRRSIRLKGYDYSQSGLYFITICTQNRQCLFGKIQSGLIILNDAGRMVEMGYFELESRFPNIQYGEMVVMPNHFHCIIHIEGQPRGISPTINSINTPTIGDIVGAFKSISTNEYIAGVKQLGWQRFNKKLWQRNYYEHIIRNEVGYLKISEYIKNNPLTWLDDTYYE